MKLEEDIVYWCKTEELAREFFNECKNQEDKDLIEDNVESPIFYNCHENETGYILKYNSDYKSFTIEVVNKEYYEQRGYKIIEYKGLQSAEQEKAEDYKEIIRKRNYLIETNFIGKLSNKKLVKEMENITAETYTIQNFTNNNTTISKPMKDEVLDFKEFFIDYLYDELKELEQKQSIVDEYRE